MTRVASWICVVGLSACQPPGVDVRATVEGQPSGLVDLGETNLWAPAPVARLSASIIVPPFSTPPVVDVVAGSRTFPTRSTAVPNLPKEQTISISFAVPVPVAPLDATDLAVGLRLDGLEVSHWTVRRTVIDPGVTLCTAALPLEVEDDSAPLTTCTTPTPEEVEANNLGTSQLELPIESTGALIHRRVAISVQRSSVGLQLRTLTVPLSTDVEVTPGAPRTVELNLGGFEWLSIGAHGLAPRRSLEKRSLVDGNPQAEAMRVRLGSSFEVVRDVMMDATPMTLVGFEDPSGALALVDALPLPLRPGTATGLHVRFTPQALASKRQFLAVLKFKDDAGVIRTDRIPFAGEGLPAAQCQLAIDEVFVDPIVVGDVKTVEVAVRNLSQDVCANAGVLGTRSVMVLASPIPAPGGTAQLRLRYTALSDGPQVEVLPVYFDAQRPTQPDLELRVNANPKR